MKQSRIISWKNLSILTLGLCVSKIQAVGDSTTENLPPPEYIPSNTLNGIPDELIIHIFNLSDPLDLFSCNLVNGHLRQISSEHFNRIIDKAFQELNEFIQASEGISKALISNQNKSNDEINLLKDQFFTNQCRLARLLVYYHRLQELSLRNEQLTRKDELQTRIVIFTNRHYLLFVKLWPKQLQEEPCLTLLRSHIRKGNILTLPLMINMMQFIMPTSFAEIKDPANMLHERYNLPKAIGLKVFSEGITPLEKPEEKETKQEQEPILSEEVIPDTSDKQVDPAAIEKELDEFIVACRILQRDVSLSMNIYEIHAIHCRRDNIRQLFDQFLTNQCRLAKLLLYYQALQEENLQIEQPKKIEKLKIKTAIWADSHYALFFAIHHQLEAQEYFQLLKLQYSNGAILTIPFMIDILALTCNKGIVLHLLNHGPASIANVSEDQVVNDNMQILREKYKLPECIALRVLLASSKVCNNALINVTGYLDTLFSKENLEHISKSEDTRKHLMEEISQIDDPAARDWVIIPLIGVWPDEDKLKLIALASHNLECILMHQHNRSLRKFLENCLLPFVLDNMRVIADKFPESPLLDLLPTRPEIEADPSETDEFLGQLFGLASSTDNEIARCNLCMGMLSHPGFSPENHPTIFKWAKETGNQEWKGRLIGRLAGVWKEDFAELLDIAAKTDEKGRYEIYVDMLGNPSFPSECYSEIFMWAKEIENPERKGYILGRLAAIWKGNLKDLLDVATTTKEDRIRFLLYVGMLKNPLFLPDNHREVFQWAKTLPEEADQEGTRKAPLLGLLATVWKEDFNDLFDAATALENEEGRYRIYNGILQNPSFSSEHHTKILGYIRGMNDEQGKKILLEQLAEIPQFKNFSELLDAVATIKDQKERSSFYKWVLNNNSHVASSDLLRQKIEALIKKNKRKRAKEEEEGQESEKKRTRKEDRHEAKAQNSREEERESQGAKRKRTKEEGSKRPKKQKEEEKEK